MLGDTAMSGAERTRRYREAHPEQVRDSAIKFRRVTKEDVLRHYGNGTAACVMCGEARTECLSIDHIAGGGLKQRREENVRGSHRFYRWLQNSNYPEGYQTLCMNCQFIKRFANAEHN